MEYEESGEVYSITEVLHIEQESRAVAGNPCDAAVIFDP